jgi:hypothetical protein
VADLAASHGVPGVRVAAANVAPGHWLVLVACFAGSFLVAGKRLDRLTELSHGPGRSSAADRGRAFLRHVLAMSSAGAVLAYCLWAFRPRHELWAAGASVATLTLFFLRYALLTDQARQDGARRRIVRDRALDALAVLWVALFAAAAYL